MFAEHQPLIADWAWQSPTNIAETIMFVRLTINRHFFTVPYVFATFKANGLSSLPCRQDQKAAEDAYPIAQVVYDNGRFGSTEEEICTPALMHTLLGVRGLGIVKSGFVCQLLTGTVGCIDRHNARIHGLTKAQFRVDCSPNVLYNRVADYIRVCKQLGGSEALWDNWCQHMTMLYPVHLGTAEDISALHYRCLVEGYMP